MPKQAENKQITSILTGEIIECKDIAKEAIDQLDDEIKRLKDNKKQIKETYRLDNKEMQVQKRFFYKLYKLDYGVVFKDMSPNTIKVLIFFLFNMNHRDNSVMINGTYHSQNSMSKYCGVGITIFKKSIKELSDMNIILTERHRQLYKVYINPLFAEDSMTEKEIYYKFYDAKNNKK